MHFWSFYLLFFFFFRDSHHFCLSERISQGDYENIIISFSKAWNHFISFQTKDLYKIDSVVLDSNAWNNLTLSKHLSFGSP